MTTKGSTAQLSPFLLRCTHSPQISLSVKGQSANTSFQVPHRLSGETLPSSTADTLHNVYGLNPAFFVPSQSTPLSRPHPAAAARCAQHSPLKAASSSVPLAPPCELHTLHLPLVHRARLCCAACALRLHLPAVSLVSSSPSSSPPVHSACGTRWCAGCVATSSFSLAAAKGIRGRRERIYGHPKVGVAIAIATS